MVLELVPKNEIDESVKSSASVEEVPVYQGSERRSIIRRVTVDRREMVRFEITPDRREIKDRRIVQQLWDGRDS